MSSRLNNANIPSSYPEISNRQRQRIATAAIQQGRQAIVVLLTVLAQKGGEVIISAGTASQLTGDMGFEVLPNPTVEGETIVRIVKGGA